MATEQLNANAILAQVRAWSLEEQLELIRSLIDEVVAHERRARQRLSVYDLAGIAHGESPAPSDEQIDAWLDERRMKEAR